MVFSERDVSSSVIYTASVNEEFDILEKEEDFYRIQLADGREGWIQQLCVQQFSGQGEVPKVKFEGIKRSEVKKFLEVAERMFSRLSQQKIFADQIIKKYKGPGIEKRSELNEIFNIYSRIEEYYDYAFRFYQDYIKDRAILFVEKTSLLTRLSGWAELLFGSANFETAYLNQPDEVNKGSIRDLSLSGSLALNKASRVDLRFSNKRDIIQTPYTSTTVDGGYSYSKEDKMRISAGFNLNSYRDAIFDLNDFNRFSLRAGTDYQVSEKANIHFDYIFLKNSYSENEKNSYSDHRIIAAARIKPKPESVLNLQFQFSTESSDSLFHKFTNIEPSVSYEKNKTNSRFYLKLLYEMFSYSELELKNFNRITAIFDSGKWKDMSSRNWNLSFTLKNFPENELANYVQLRGRYASSKSGRLNFRFSPSIYTNLYTNNSEVSFTDFKVDMMGTSRAFFHNLSAYFRFWHNPGDENQGEIVKPHVFDLYGKLGFNFKYVKIGPAFGVHALVSSEEGVEFFKRDGNLLRIGAFIEGRVPLPKRINLTLNGSYEYGFVYNNELSVDLLTGQIEEGEAMLRHPTTLQLNSTISAPVYKNIEVIGRVSFYRVATDMDEKLSISPIIHNKRFFFLVGIRYRHN
ncbi:SH3 domain-containing protein [Acidobacteriota bacterium]